MKKYFVNGKEVSEKEVKLIEKRNKEYMESGDFSLIAKCEFITVISKQFLIVKQIKFQSYERLQ